MNSFKRTKAKREVLNSFHLTSDLEDLLYSAPVFTIEEEESEIIKYKRTKITFQPTFATDKSSWISPDIDTLNILDFCSVDRFLFNTLLERGYDSRLIRIFAQNELENSPFKDPEYDTILIKRKTSIKSDNTVTYHYHLNGGSEYFQRILYTDGPFWLELLRACKETNLLEVSQVHIAADCSVDLMKYVSNSIRKGHYECKGLNPTGFYTYRGKKEAGSLGKFSSNYCKLKDNEVEIQTVYFGETRRQPISLVFYNKEKEEMERNGCISISKTRIELRFNAKAGPSLPPAFLESLIKSYYVPNGAGFRTKVFLHHLSTSVQFTTRFRSEGSPALSNWWRHAVLIPLYHVSLDMFPECIDKYLVGTQVLALLPPGEPSTETPTKRKRGRPKGQKDTKPRKRKTTKNTPIDIETEDCPF